jgi:hypothetical protein
MAASDKPTITGASPSFGSTTGTRFVDELIETNATQQWELRSRKRYPGSAAVSTAPLQHPSDFFAHCRRDTRSRFNSVAGG